MKKSRFTEEQIAFALKQVETVTKATEVCRKMGISEAFYSWKKKYGELGGAVGCERGISGAYRELFEVRDAREGTTRSLFG